MGLAVKTSLRIFMWSQQSLLSEGPRRGHTPGSGTKFPWGQWDASSQGSKLTTALLPWWTLEECHQGSHMWGHLPPNCTVAHTYRTERVRAPLQVTGATQSPERELQNGWWPHCFVHARVTTMTVIITSDRQTDLTKCSFPVEHCASLSLASPTQVIHETTPCAEHHRYPIPGVRRLHLRVSLTCPRSHSFRVAAPGFELKLQAPSGLKPPCNTEGSRELLGGNLWQGCLMLLFYSEEAVFWCSQPT